MGNVRIVVHRPAVGAILKGQPMQRVLARKAEAIKAEAGDGHVTSVEVGANRARATVITATVDAMKAEAHDANLTSSIDAGRV